MSEVKRWGVLTDTNTGKFLGCTTMADGTWVAYADYEALRKRMEEAQALRSEVVGIIMSIEESGDWQCVVAHSTQIFRVDPTVGCALSPAENGPHLIGRKVVIADGCMIYNPLYMPSEGELTIEGGNDE